MGYGSDGDGARRAGQRRGQRDSQGDVRGGLGGHRHLTTRRVMVGEGGTGDWRRCSSPTSLTTTNWAAAQTVTVRAEQDNDAVNETVRVL